MEYLLARSLRSNIEPEGAKAIGPMGSSNQAERRECMARALQIFPGTGSEGISTVVVVEGIDEELRNYSRNSTRCAAMVHLHHVRLDDEDPSMCPIFGLCFLSIVTYLDGRKRGGWALCY